MDQEKESGGGQAWRAAAHPRIKNGYIKGAVKGARPPQLKTNSPGEGLGGEGPQPKSKKIRIRFQIFLEVLFLGWMPKYNHSDNPLTICKRINIQLNSTVQGVEL